MFVQQFYVPSLGHYSYLIGSTDAGVAFVLDPKRDIDDYLATAQEQGVRITHILETHLHNDYVSGNRELAAATGATICHSAGAALEYDYHPLHEGDTLRFGELVVRVLETPGHTPEHLAYTVVDTGRSADLPVLILTGGDLLIGSVGRPDLLGPELGRKLAPQLYDSLHNKILPVGDGVQVLPTHGGGSSCGADISSTRTSTVGYEKATNPYLQHPTRDAFVAAVLAGQPTKPAYYQRMRPTNQHGPRIWLRYPQPPALGLRAFQEARAAGALVIDTRPPLAFGSAHVPESIGIGLDSIFTTWVGSTVPADTPLLLVLDTPEVLDEVVRQLMRIDYDQVAGYLRGGFGTWLGAGLPVETLPQLSVQELEADLAAGHDLLVVDVRNPTEWAAGHIPGAIHLVANQIRERAGELPRDRVIATICGAGYRSTLAASWLRRAGFTRVVNVMGGMSAWNKQRFPTVTEDGHR